MNTKQSIFSLILASIFGLSCVGENSVGFVASSGRSGVSTPSEAVVVEGSRTKETWIQGEVNNPKLDLLLIVDYSGSMRNERQSIINALQGFIEQITSSQVDLCLGVTRANPEDNSIHHLYRGIGSAGDALACTNGSATQNAQVRDKIANNLGANLFSGTADEGGLMSLLRSVTTQNQHYLDNGFFRDDAALAVIFATDEADFSEVNVAGGFGPGTVCPAFGGGIVPELTPLGLSPIELASCNEGKFRYEYYSDPSGARIWDYQTISSEIDQFQGTLQSFYALIGIRNLATDGVLIPNDPLNRDDEVTYGYNEFVALKNGPFIPIRLADEAAEDPLKQEEFNSALQDIGAAAAQAATLQTVFDLQTNACEGSVSVRVDGSLIDGFSVSEKVLGDGSKITRVNIVPSEAGEGGNSIEITYKPVSQGC